ncbi:MAG TPA: aldose epimerase family protein [Haliangium sp.]|nr:aldose epimerase family protein [Haliangium sp.]
MEHTSIESMGESTGTSTAVERARFGATDGIDIDSYVLRHAGITARVITYGAILTELHVPDRHGKSADIVLGFDQLDGYLAEHPYFGATVGRVANRIAGGSFTLDGVEHRLACNNGRHHLHGGLRGFDRRVWSAVASVTPDGPSVTFRYTSPDSEQGYPGTLDVTTVYTLRAGALRIAFTARADRATPVSLTHHSYFNLAGAGSGDILGHELRLAASRYTPTDAELIPTGELAPVAGTAFDFRTPTPIGARATQTGLVPAGYDHNFVLDRDAPGLAHAATVRDPGSGRVLDVYTTAPGIQVYTGNFLDGSLTGKAGHVYRQYGALCLEPQHFPNAINEPRFPSPVLRPGQVYEHTLEYRFSAA